MFQDEANIYLKSGDGGDGMISFRREKFVPLGGPDGGDGGRGGHIIFRVNSRMNSLNPVKSKVHYRAEPGKNGGRKQQTGANGSDLILEVPPGTVIRDRDTGSVLAELIKDDDEAVANQMKKEHYPLYRYLFQFSLNILYLLMLQRFCILQHLLVCLNI